MQKYLLAIIYIVLCLLIGNCHPFAPYDMYSSFPNYAYYFYITDGEDNAINSADHFGMTRGELAHCFYAACQKHGFEYGFGKEQKEALEIVGKEMLDRMLFGKKQDRLPYKSLKVYNVHLHLENNRIIKDERLLYQTDLEGLH